jgi:hypothetical protein
VSEAASLGVKPVAKPPVEVVLPLPYYVLLAVELVALVALYRVRPTTASDPVGHGIGWAGTASMCIMHVYSLRRRVRALSRWGKLRTWLQFHIFMGLQGAMLVTFHSLHLKTITNLSGLTIAMTGVVVCSGVFGRYLYSLIPKSLSGERLTALEIEAELRDLAPLLKRSAQPDLEAAMAEYERTTPLDARPSFRQLVEEDMRARRALGHAEQAIRNAIRVNPSSDLELFALALKRRVLLTRRMAMLTGAERLFRNWTILHKPLTYVLGGTLVLHVISHYIYAAQFGA